MSVREAMQRLFYAPCVEIDGALAVKLGYPSPFMGWTEAQIILKSLAKEASRESLLGNQLFFRVVMLIASADGAARDETWVSTPWVQGAAEALWFAAGMVSRGEFSHLSEWDSEKVVLVVQLRARTGLGEEEKSARSDQH